MKKKLSLRSQIIIILLVFIAFILGLIYISQTFFLDDFYRKNKITIIERTGNEIAASIQNNNDIDEYLSNINMNQEICARVINGNNTVSNSRGFCVLNNLNYEQLSEIAFKTRDNGGEKVFDNFKVFGPTNEDLYIYSKLVDVEDVPTLVLVSSVIKPLDTTVNTIADQFKIIVLVVVVAAILLGLFISRILLKPINKINEEAKSLPKGNYEGNKIKANNSEINELNNTLIQANEEIQKADKAKKELLANVSHDLRTPLTMIVGYAEMIKDMPDEDVTSNAEVIIEEGKRLSSLVDDLIDVSRYESNRFVLKEEIVSLNKLLKSVYKQYEKYCKEQKVKFKLKLIDDIQVKVDENRIKQVLYNFINNGLNYNDKKKKEIELGVEKRDDNYRVYVKDNGQGIEEKNLSKVWDRYYKVDKEHKRVHLGSGIGLSLSKDILEASHLNYGVESIKEKGSIFYFEISSKEVL